MKTRSKRVAIIVDNPNRDLPGMVLLAWKLCQQNVTCYLVPLNVCRRDLFAIAPDFILLNYIKRNNEGMVKGLLEAGALAGVLDTEGAVFSPPHSQLKPGAKAPSGAFRNMQEYALMLAEDEKVLKSLSLVCAWTPQFAQYVSTEKLFDPKQVVVTGTPRSDYYASQFRKAALACSRYAEKFPEPIILINGSFAFANPRFKSPEEELQGRFKTGDRTLESLKEWQQIQYESMKSLAKVTNDLAQRMPEASFIYRPHPFESLNTYHTLLELNRPNIFLENKGTVEGWLLRCKGVIQVASSTAINATVLGIPVFDPKWIPRRAAVPIADAVSVPCRSPEVLLTEIQAVLDGTYETPKEISENRDESICKAFYKVDGFSHERVANAICERLWSSENEVSVNKCKEILGQSNEPLRGIVRRNLLRWLDLPSDWSFRHWKSQETKFDTSEKLFTSEQVQGIVKSIESCMEQDTTRIEVSDIRRGNHCRVYYPYVRSIAMEPLD